MRTIKFRAWNKSMGKWVSFKLSELQNSQWDWEDFENWCEFTGLKDKNGKEIYEGDIVKAIRGKDWKRDKHMTGGEVTWNKKECRFALNEFVPIHWGGFESLEVIGNIYENPNLLK